MISFHNVIDGLDLLIITESGMIIRLPIEQVSQLGRVTQGVKLINLKEEQYVSTISLLRAALAAIWCAMSSGSMSN